jgi:hypothetical protein
LVTFLVSFCLFIYSALSKEFFFGALHIQSRAFSYPRAPHVFFGRCNDTPTLALSRAILPARFPLCWHTLTAQQFPLEPVHLVKAVTLLFFFSISFALI